MSSTGDRSIGPHARVISIVALINACTITLMYSVNMIFGPINDVGVGVFGALIAVLAWKLDALARAQQPRMSTLPLAAALVGGVIVVLGSALVVGRITGWVLAGLVTNLGYAVIGLWAATINRRAGRSASWPAGLSRLGLAAGSIMLLGFFTIPAIAMRVDSMAGAPSSMYVGYLGGLGWFVLLPDWSYQLWRVRSSSPP